MWAQIRERLLELGRDHGAESKAMVRRQHQVEGEHRALIAEDARYRVRQDEYDRRLRAYEAELGRYISFRDDDKREDGG